MSALQGREDGQQRLDGRRPGRDADDKLEGIPQLLWTSSPDSTWREVAAEASRRGLLGGGDP